MLIFVVEILLRYFFCCVEIGDCVDFEVDFL